MEWFNAALSAQAVADFETWLEAWGALAFIGLFFFELLRLAVKRRLSWKLAGDSLASFLTFGFLILVTYGLIAAAYVSVFYWAYLNFALFEIPVTPWSIALLVVLCDFAYYWEHRFTHRVGLAWATHSVHHSSPYFNISVAYRFGPMDGFWPVFFHLPLAVAGFDPLLIFAGEAFVQLCQTILHTQLIGKLPRPIEWLMNTPSHHRVHHGNNPAYIDRNYGGIFIIWDRLFGSFAEEREAVQFGLTEQIDSVNPLTVYFHGFIRLARRALHSGSYGEAAYALVAPPEWTVGQRRSPLQSLLLPCVLILAGVLALGSYPGNAEDQPAPAEDSRADTPLSETQLRELATRYYRASLAGDEDSAYAQFAEDAYLHYKMDFGLGYGSIEFALRVDEEWDDSDFDDYAAFDPDYNIVAVSVDPEGGTVEVVRTESYRWDGYTGKMTARETLTVRLAGNTPRVTRFASDQVYR